MYLCLFSCYRKLGLPQTRLVSSWLGSRCRKGKSTAFLWDVKQLTHCWQITDHAESCWTRTCLISLQLSYVQTFTAKQSRGQLAADQCVRNSPTEVDNCTDLCRCWQFSGRASGNEAYEELILRPNVHYRKQSSRPLTASLRTGLSLQVPLTLMGT